MFYLFKNANVVKRIGNWLLTSKIRGSPIKVVDWYANDIKQLLYNELLNNLQLLSCMSDDVV
jgi:hypothetical protein